MEYICKFCGKLCKNLNSLHNHERLCPKNPDRNYVSHTKGHKAWNKGLSKETDDRIANQSKTFRERYHDKTGLWFGKKHSEETKKKISETQKKNYAGKSRYIPVQEHRKSYAEQYFDVIFTDAQKQFPVDRYRLDYAWPDTKTYIEVDGEQHYTEEGLKHDNERTQVLESLGWTCKKRIRWSEYQKLNEDEKKAFIDSLL
jgi:very-short-patch-repair endonuclease